MKDNYISNFFNMIKLNLNTFIKFEIIYKLLISIVFIPSTISCFKLIMNMQNLKSLSASSIGQIILNPIMLIYLIVVIILSIAVILFEIINIIIIFDMSYHNKKTTLKETLKISLLKSKNVYKIKNIPVILYLILLTPFINLSVFGNVSALLKMPESAVSFIIENRLILLYGIGVYLLIIALLSDWLYILHYILIEDLDIKSAQKKSKKLAIGNALRDHLKIMVCQFIYAATVIGFIIIGLFILSLIYEIIKGTFLLSDISIIAVTLIIIVFFILIATISTGISYSLISSLFYKHKKDKKERIANLKYDDNESTFFIKKVIKCTAGLVLIMIGVLSFFDQNSLQVESKPIEEPKEERHKIEITAHRGSSKYYPENSMSAFRGAAENGAKWIELDVQQTKDGRLVISHDDTLGRVAGYPKKIINMTFDEARRQDIGKLFGDKFAGEQIPTLEEAIIFAKNSNVKLNIELKPCGLEKEFEKQVVDIVRKYNFEDQCIISSGSYQTIKRVKEIDDRFKTAYIMAILVMDIDKLEYADIYSIEASNVTADLVKKIHKSNKEVHVWTINTEEMIRKMIELEVDNIITDDIILGQQLVAEKEMSIITMSATK